MTTPAESPSRIEPCLLDDTTAEIVDLVASLAAAASALGSRLHPRSAEGLADLVRVMNCYYSNLIEGHNTTPREIERALASVELEKTRRRDLALEARAHIRVQREIDQMFRRRHLARTDIGRIHPLAAPGLLRETPDEMLISIRMQNLKSPMHPWRIPPSRRTRCRRRTAPAAFVGARVAAFMDAFRANAFACEPFFERQDHRHRGRASPAELHPPIPGRKRARQPPDVACYGPQGRALARKGCGRSPADLARGLENRGEYKRMMDHADTPRQGDLDGRGNLSRRALAEFTEWFLKVCLDQVTFMSGLFALDTLARPPAALCRIAAISSPSAFAMLEQVLQRGRNCRAARPGASPALGTHGARSARRPGA